MSSRNDRTAAAVPRNGHTAIARKELLKSLKERRPKQKPSVRKFPNFFDPARRTPIIQEMVNRGRVTAPIAMAGLVVHAVLHLEDNVLAFIAGLMDLGLDPARVTLYAKGRGYRYGNKNAVIRQLRRWRVTVRGTEEIHAAYFEALAKRTIAAGERVLFIEDGPFFGANLLARADLWPHVVGCLQQTTRGMPQYLTFQGELPFPVLSLPESELKRMKEPPYIGKTFMRAISAAFPHREWGNQRIAIYGSGVIGRAAGDAASALCMQPVYVDKSPRAQILADNLCGPLASPTSAAKEAAILAGFTGGIDGPSITDEVLAAAPHGVIVASGSSEQFEIDLNYLVAAGRARPLHIDGVPRSPKSRVGTTYTIGPRAKEIHLLNDGWPLTFIGIPGTTLPDQLADFVMAMMLVATIELGAGRFAGAGGIVPGAIDLLADQWGIPAAYLRYWRS